MAVTAKLAPADGKRQDHANRDIDADRHGGHHRAEFARQSAGDRFAVLGDQAQAQLPCGHCLRLRDVGISPRVGLRDAWRGLADRVKQERLGDGQAICRPCRRRLRRGRHAEVGQGMTGVPGGIAPSQRRWCGLAAEPVAVGRQHVDASTGPATESDNVGMPAFVFSRQLPSGNSWPIAANGVAAPVSDGPTRRSRPACDYRPAATAPSRLSRTLVPSELTGLPGAEARARRRKRPIASL